MRESLGVRKLRKKVKDRGGQRLLASELDVSQATVSRWLSGERRPGIRFRMLMQGMYRISWKDWER